ncbi:MAG: putative DNA-binding protein [Clostridia bacterium]|nr:putative DNA-binding protein [Clostridia bacterium]
MEEKIKISILCQIYGKLLTEKQYQILDDYYNNDLSLSEIAENNNITRQAVNDVINKAKNKLIEIEEKLLLMEKILNQEKVIENIIKNLEESENKILKKAQIEKIKKQLKQLL